MDVLKDFARMSQRLGSDPAFVQGGGGNTSAKLNDTDMAIKASGFRLNQITETEAFVQVKHKEIKDYFLALDVTRDVDIEKEGSEFIKARILQDKNPNNLRPSVETGFHSILNRFVIHTHSVYANLICCAVGGEALMKKLFAKGEIRSIWVPYTHPGILLTERIRSLAKAYLEENGMEINTIFMENHGVIVTEEDADKGIELHAQINKSIRDFFSLTDGFPKLSLVLKGQDLYAADCPYLTGFFKDNEKGLDNFAWSIYPDHIVYLDDVISFNGGSAKVDINTKSGEILYRTGEVDAVTCNEILAAYIYVIDTLQRKGLEIKTMAPRFVDLIKNWESEAYRRQLVKDFKA